MSAEQAADLLARRGIWPEPGAAAAAALRGFVIARWRGVPVACVEWRHGQGESCVPKGRMLECVDLPDPSHFQHSLLGQR